MKEKQYSPSNEDRQGDDDKFKKLEEWKRDVPDLEKRLNQDEMSDLLLNAQELLSKIRGSSQRS